MIEFLSFCGFFFSHAVWSISDGSTLIAIGAKGNGQQKPDMVRFVNEEHYELSVEEAKSFLKKESDSNRFVAIYFDGYFTYPDGDKMDAIYMVAHFKTDTVNGELTMCVPYRKKSFFRKFRVFKPKLVNFSGFAEKDITDSYESFWNGIYSHKKGSEVWNKAIDQSK